MPGGKISKGAAVVAAGAVAAIALAMVVLPRVAAVEYKQPGADERDRKAREKEGATGSETKEPEAVPEPEPVTAHLDAPEAVKAVYMTSWVAGTPSLREKIIGLIDQTELNAVVIDIKDDTGRVSFSSSEPKLVAAGSIDVRVRDMRELVARLHEKGIYVIGRIAAFQDPHMAKVRPDLAVRNAKGEVWRDRKGLTWIDAGSKEHWDYLIAIGKASFEAGFDELNFDYVRFPTDGRDDMTFPFSEGKDKPAVLKGFFEYLDPRLKDPALYSNQGGRVPVVSADLFGMTTTAEDDMGIGQLLENAFPHFDYIAPMVYPSHYPVGFNGWGDPNAVPYEIVKFAMESAVERQRIFRERVASTTPDAPYLPRLVPDQLRPWLQDNDYPVHYTPAMVRAQMKATYDAGLDSWMLWDAGNTYTRAALLDG